VPLDAATRRRLTHGGLIFNAPLGEARAAALVAQAAAIGPATALDLGCGWGELLLRVCEATGAQGTGVDEEGDGLERGRALAAARGLADRVIFVAGDCTRWQGTADVVLCVAASHAWGGHQGMFDALSGHVAPGGRVLVGDGYFAAPPSDDLREWFGDLPSLAELCDAAAERFAVLHHSASTPDEWDEFESRWRAGLETSEDPEALAFAAQRRREYLDGYRGVSGMAWLVLQPR
jgi:cyclopropane fatty-acyl-phospholipid synthase-like methyltransferase